ncbi:MAG: hypothetical protein Ct9H300mP1_25360 [Planctomycetaceae bacterium]|nr:MAG: hypothetical protein Ct9H300mP1_25360 [Planctomycetaceae bacterium]
MFPSLFQHGPDTLDIRLAVSRDGIRWSRPDRKTAFIALGKGKAFDSGSLYMGQGMIRGGENCGVLFRIALRHQGAELENLTKPENARVYSRVGAPGWTDSSPLRQDQRGGSFTSPPLRFTGNRLHLNVRVPAAVACESVFSMRRDVHCRSSL